MNVLTYTLLLASIVGSLVDRPSKARQHTTGPFMLEAVRWQDVNDNDDDDDDDEFTIIATRFLFPEKPKNPMASL